MIDSVQTLHTATLDASPGSVGQVRECTAEIMRFAKVTDVPFVLIGHITKDGFIAGPKVLEHMVDCVLQFEGDRDHAYRLLRPLKNRFGSTNELGIYEMHGTGLAAVEDPSQVLLGDRRERPSGVAVSATLEGQRPLLIEVQALVSSAVYGTPQRSATGFDLRRLNMLLAVLEKRCGFRLGQKDVFLNLAGGFRVEEPAIDLAVVCAVLSSNADIAIPHGHRVLRRGGPHRRDPPRDAHRTAHRRSAEARLRPRVRAQGHQGHRPGEGHRARAGGAGERGAQRVVRVRLIGHQRT